jgi:putative transposase
MTTIVDWYSRFCVEALREALEKHGNPEIFNTDQGSPFTSAEFTGILASHGIAISMDGKGRALDNIFAERFWRTVKHDDVYIRLAQFFERYNNRRKHTSLEGHYPADVYFGKVAIIKAA